ncbi:tol-pal system protein YbgF [Longimicrobium sp.]|jgi:tol-pal system protein YbgF|uniref:tol-pal system protein YbgF n=1 Tax=Longimicrobium sp. TaxID=2029185 RepID=UPI002ED787F2
MRRAALAALAFPLLAGCIATKQDIRDLQLGMASQQARQDSMVTVLIARTEAMLDSLSDQNVRLRGDLANRLVAIDRQLVQIQELSGQNQAQLGALRRQVDTAAEEARRAQAAAQRADAAPQEEAADPQELFDAALAALRRGSVATARGGFEEFLRAAPEHRLAPDAQYNIGQSYEQARDVPAAITAYERVLSEHATSARAPAALLRIGRLELGRGNRTQARTRLNQVVQRFPRSPEAAEARTELQRLGTR